MNGRLFKACEYNIFSSDAFLGIKAHLSQSRCVGANLFWHLLHFCNKYSSIKTIFRLCFVYFRWWFCSRKETISYITRFLPALLQNSHFQFFFAKILSATQARKYECEHNAMWILSCLCKFPTYTFERKKNFFLTLRKLL